MCVCAGVVVVQGGGGGSATAQQEMSTRIGGFYMRLAQKQMAKAATSEHPDRRILYATGSKANGKSSNK